MNYIKSYIKLCRRGIQRLKVIPRVSGEHELHHVFPKSIYGNNNSIALLTLREHYIAHLLLVKICIKRYGLTAPNTRKMLMAVHKMVYRFDKKILLNSKQYEVARKYVILAKKNTRRLDMVGKKYFGASEEKIKAGLKKMAEGKIGKKINYPINRKSRGEQTIQTIEKIKITKQSTNEKYVKMSEEQFLNWINKCKMYSVDGRKNGNVIRAINARGESIKKYYGNK